MDDPENHHVSPGGATVANLRLSFVSTGRAPDLRHCRRGPTGVEFAGTIAELVRYAGGGLPQHRHAKATALNGIGPRVLAGYLDNL
jgi:hypothetical protein